MSGCIFSCHQHMGSRSASHVAPAIILYYRIVSTVFQSFCNFGAPCFMLVSRRTAVADADALSLHNEGASLVLGATVPWQSHIALQRFRGSRAAVLQYCLLALHPFLACKSWQLDHMPASEVCGSTPQHRLWVHAVLTVCIDCCIALPSRQPF